MDELLWKHELRAEPDGTVVTRTKVGPLEVNDEAVVLHHTDGDRRLRWEDDHWEADGEPHAGPRVSEELEVLLRHASRAPSPVEALADALAIEWLASRAEHLIDASEMDLSSVHAPPSLPVIALVAGLVGSLPLCALGNLEPWIGLGGIVSLCLVLASVGTVPFLFSTRSQQLTLTSHEIRFVRRHLMWSTSWNDNIAEVVDVVASGDRILVQTRTGTRTIELPGRTQKTAEAIARVIQIRLRRAIGEGRADVPEALQRLAARRQLQ